MHVTGKALARSSMIEGNEQSRLSSCTTWQPNRNTANCRGERFSSATGISCAAACSTGSSGFAVGESGRHRSTF